MSTQLPQLTFEDLEVTYCRKRKHSITSSSTGSSGNSSPSSTATSESNISSNSGLSKPPCPATTPVLKEDCLQRKRTIPTKFCPKAKAPTNRFQPANTKESKAPKIAYIAKPLQHIPKRPLAENTAMQQYRAYRQLEMEKAQAAKVNGGLEEPPKKKSAPRRRKERNY